MKFRNKVIINIENEDGLELDKKDNTKGASRCSNVGSDNNINVRNNNSSNICKSVLVLLMVEIWALKNNGIEESSYMINKKNR